MNENLSLRINCFKNQFFKKIKLNTPIDLITRFEESVKELDNEFVSYSDGELYDWEGLILTEERIKSTPCFYELIYKYLPFEEILRARVYRLKPKGYCGSHIEPWEPQKKGNVICCTLNIPLNTYKDSFIAFKQGRRLFVDKGEAFFLNFSKFHSAQNIGTSVRYHLKVTGLMTKDNYKKCFNQPNMLSSVNIWSSNLSPEILKWKHQQHSIESHIIWADDLIGERIVDILKPTSQVRVICFHDNQKQLDLKREVVNVWSNQKQSDLASFIKNFCEKNNLYLKETNPMVIRATFDLWNNQKCLRESLKNIKNTVKELKWIHIDTKNIYHFLNEECDTTLSDKKKVLYLGSLLEAFSYEERKLLLKKITNNHQLIAFSNNTSF